ncbi:MAG: hypothetical protein IJH34_00270 [Romboutsia sp.]|nr:hypothetical protein [Romboutsia sp.]
MKKALLASIKPYYYYLIGEGIKKVEVRKRIPKDPDWNKEILFYMTKDKKSFNMIPKEYQEKYEKHFGKVGLKVTYTGYIEAQHGNYVILNRAGACVDSYKLLNYADEKTLYGWQLSDPILNTKPRDIFDFFPAEPKPKNKWTDKDDCCHCRYHKWVWKGRPSGLPWYEKCTSKLPEPECEYTPSLDNPPQSYCFVSTYIAK